MNPDIVNTAEYKLNFGKYRGKSVKYILMYDPQYLLWASKHTDKIRLSKKIRLRAEMYSLQQEYDEEEEHNKWEVLGPGDIY